MRPISHFPIGGNRKQRIPNHVASTNNNSEAKINTHRSPVWGRSKAAVVAIASSPPSTTDTAQSPPIPQSSVWGRSSRIVLADSGPASYAHNNKATSMNITSQRILRSNGSTSPSSIDDYRDEVIATEDRCQHKPLVDPLEMPSSPKLSHELCTIAEDRRISSNTLQQMAIASTAAEIAASPVLAKNLLLQQPPSRSVAQQRAVHDPYHDDDRDGSGGQECINCWPYRDSETCHWWPFRIPSSSTINNKVRVKNNRFPARHPSTHLRHSSF